MDILKELLARGCAHRFSWPRVGNDGRHYQVCLDCGTAYEYDWCGMRRTGRLAVPQDMSKANMLRRNLGPA